MLGMALTAGSLERSSRPRFRAVHRQGQVRPPAEVAGEVASQDAPQVVPVEDNDLAQTLPPDAADHPFRERILPRALS